MLNAPSSKYKNFFEQDISLNVIILGLLLIGISALVYIAPSTNTELIALGAVLILPLIYFVINHQKVWIYSVLIAKIPYLLTTSEGVSVIDVLMAVFLIGGLIVWFVRKIFVVRERLIQNTADWLILFFFIVMSVNSVIAILNGVEILDWGREYGMILMTLYYFPLREIFKDEEDLKKLMIFLIPLMLVMTIGHFYQYYLRLTSIVMEYAYQLGSSIRTNQIIFTVASIFGFIFTFNQKNRFREILMMALTTMFIGGLLITFTRTFWVILFVALVFIFFFLEFRKKIRFLLYLFIAIVVIAGAILLFWQDNAKTFIKVVEKRLTSTSQVKDDPSARVRLDEWERVLFHIQEHPLGGNGLAKTFTFYNILDQHNLTKNIIHNGYLYFMYRVGIPLSLLYFFFIGFYSLRSLLLIFKIKKPLFRNLNIAAFAGMLTLIGSNLLSSQFAYRDGIFMVAFCVAIISICYNYYISEENPPLKLTKSIL